MEWKVPPTIKIYEALGAIGDGRVVIEGNKAKVFSSSGNKHYAVEFNEETNAITANDNGSFYQGYLGYPSIAYLMLTEHLPNNLEYARALSGIAWKDLNIRFKSNYGKTEEYACKLIHSKGVDLADFESYLQEVERKIAELRLERLASSTKPPTAY